MIRDSLRGVRVLDFSHVLAGPVCSMMLADFGADVVKIEPPFGELGRKIGPPWINGESVANLSVNRNKRSLAIDLKTEAGQRTIREMVRQADVIVENFRPGVMATWGLDYASLEATHGKLVYCSISAFGQTGASRCRPAVDGIIQAASGLMSTLGEPGSAPLKVPVPVADMVGGYMATIAVLAALHEVHRGGVGQHLDISLFTAAIALQQVGFTSFLASDTNPEKVGSAAPYASPNEAFQTRDGWLMIAAYHPHRWVSLCEAVDLPHLESDPRFVTNTDRVRNRAALRRALGECFATRTTSEWLDLLAARDILCAPVSTYREVVDSREYRESGIDSSVDHPIAGKVRLPGFALGKSDDTRAADVAAPLVGQHSIEVLAEYGVTHEEITRLIGLGVIQTAAAQDAPVSL
ncbi:CaiB/BaiF CoA-transferase family protein [Pandoraea sp. B-6]|uniref:CaiB/BaiF CoA transferase family protein n=1 Tax=Pandoraea sp. B-6 TaxID=1204340 RepID=UPI000584DF66|nr:CoA transferase [Pandoraea sp. B-6]